MDPLVYFDDNFGKYRPILIIFSLLQQEIHDAQKLSYFSHLTFIMLPLYLAKQTLMPVSMRIFLDHATKQISMYSNGWNIYLAYLFAAKFHDVTVMSLLCLCIICYKTDVPAGRLIHEREYFCRNVRLYGFGQSVPHG